MGSLFLTQKIEKKEDKVSPHFTYFNNHKKKDDLADSFLQALWYINVKMRTT